MGNLCEEMAEYYRATNNDEKIDALCYMYVFCMNSLGYSIEHVRKKIKCEDFLNLRLSPKFRFISLDFINNFLKKAKKDNDKTIEIILNIHFYSLMQSAEVETTELGYNFYECMLETIKEISSRTGHYDENIHKFVKDISDEAVKNWYKADYSKCKIKG